MKKLFFAFVALACLSTGHSRAQEPVESSVDSLKRVVDDLSARLQAEEKEKADRAIWKNRSKYFNLGFVSQKLSGDAIPELKSDFGASLSWGKTYYLHRKPLAGLLKFGLDWSWLDLNYAKYSYDLPSWAVDPEYGDADESIGASQMEIGMQFGPSVTINPVHQLKINAYFRATPSYSMMFLDGDVYSNYATFFNVGGAVSWKVISVGVEWRWGNAKYKGIMDFDEEYDYDDDWSESLPASREKFKTSSLRLYVSFRF